MFARFPTYAYRQAYYNPYTCDTFVDKETGEPLTEALFAVICGREVFYK
jgi:hypothetical protein